MSYELDVLTLYKKFGNTWFYARGSGYTKTHLTEMALKGHLETAKPIHAGPIAFKVKYNGTEPIH